MKKKISLGLILILVLSLVSIPVFAKDEGFYADDDVSLQKNVGQTTFAAGNNVEISSEIDGLAFVAGNNITLSSSQDHLFAAGNSVNLENVSTKDAFLAGNTVNVQSSNIRDLYAAGQNIRIDSNIGRNLYVAGQNVTINSVINGDVIVSAENVRIGKDAVINGTLKYEEGTSLSISETASVAKKKEFKSDAVKVEVNPTKMFMSKVSETIYAYLSLLVISLILLAISKKSFAKVEKLEKSAGYVLKASLIGLAMLIGLPILAIIVMLTVIGLPLSIISLMFYGILIYLSYIGTSYYFGKWFLKDKIKNDYLLLTVSLLIIYVIRLIPIIGGLVGFISLIFGLGMYTLLIKDNIKAKK